ncbi:unnamed protein product [Brassica oleracea]
MITTGRGFGITVSWYWNNNNGFKYNTTHTNNNFEAAHNNSSSNMFQLVFDSPPFDMFSFDYRNDMQQKQQDVSTWF